MTTHIIYHDHCADGALSAYIAKVSLEYAGKSSLMHPMSYRQPVPREINQGDTVYILDFAFPREVMLKLADRCRIILLDHHKTTRNDLEGIEEASKSSLFDIKMVFDMNKCGARLTWEHFHKGVPAPWIVNYVEDRDLWHHKLPGTKEVSAFIAHSPRDSSTWLKLFEEAPRNIIDAGAFHLQAVESRVREAVKSSYTIMFEGHENIPVSNIHPWHCSDVLSVLREGHPFALSWCVMDGHVLVSARSSDDGEDVSVIAKQYGGGGHRNAAGFTIPLSKIQLILP